MKNTLAENMLRFGVKNLKESDVKRIEESALYEQTQPVQPFAEINPRSWKFTNEQAYHDTFDHRLYPVKIDTQQALNKAYGSWCLETIPSTGGKQRVRTDAMIVAGYICVDLALLMAVEGKYNPINSYGNFAQVLTRSEQMGSRINNIIANNHIKGNSVIGNTRYGVDASNMTPNQWTATLQLIAPYITAVIQKNVIPATPPKPMAPTPGAPKQ